MSEEIRVLCVGSEVDIATKCVEWNEYYNVKDYDWVFLDFFSLDVEIGDSNAIAMLGDRPISHNSDDVFKALISGTNFVILLPRRSRVPLRSNTSLPISDTLPASFSLKDESGNSLDDESVDAGWKWYFNSNFKWNLRIDPQIWKYEYQGESFTSTHHCLAANSSHEYLASRIQFKGDDLSNSSVEDSKVELPGSIDLIPVIKDWQPSTLIKEILDRFTDLEARIKTENSPEWVDEWGLPGEDATLAELEELRREKSRIEEQIEETNRELQEYEEYKVLLWGNEGSLEELVPEVFREMGLEVEGEQPHGRDGMIKLGDERIILEITGTTNDIKDQKCRQLSAWVDDMELEDSDKFYTGLLVANPDRLTDPADRNPDGYLPPHLRSFLQKRRYNVLLTPELYTILSQYRQDELDTDDIEELLLQDGLPIEAN